MPGSYHSSKNYDHNHMQFWPIISNTTAREIWEKQLRSKKDRGQNEAQNAIKYIFTAILKTREPIL